MTTYDRAEAAVSAERIDSALAGTKREPYWLDDPRRPEAVPPARGDLSCDLAVVGGGYTGLWTALLAKERDPNRHVMLFEGKRIGWAASGRNGGFCEASLTHGASNGERHLPKETARLHELGLENVREIGETVRRYNMDCGYEETGVLRVATEEHQVAWLQADANKHPELIYMDRDRVRAEVNSPLYHAGLWEQEGNVLVQPARLAWELRRVCLELGVEIYEHSPVIDLEAGRDHISLTVGGTESGTTEQPLATVTAQRVALASNVFPSLLRRARPFTVPVWDYALMSNPLTAEQSAALGWSENQGLADMNNRFHYIRKTRDDEGRERILFGGYDALYHFGKGLKEEYYDSEPTYRRLVAHFYETFPVLGDLGFSHAWGGAIDSCSRFFSFFTRAHGDRVVGSSGYTGLGVGATRFGANVTLDLLDGVDSERTRLELVRKKPIPFPPEPVAWMGVQITTSEMARSDRNQGKRGLWLSTMDAIGMGFDS
ncbi:NAD(P)/FAD-dependent oxidoreductase [Leucobacter sp. M11]|uniref:NAD(P)/FAD-dependent oxidoreductase n=1 Tax=Leucobacter sp. M11 TaxID=2993565 RepID=UPI002D80E07A|nr:FAD-dependent oxidoreductase [Leucobacter sp. M11]MEB4614478.1 FAD-dependent oxidoreductase [Leucobacter sp. M11]